MTDCKHPSIATWTITETGEPAELWSCRECGHKFVPIAQLISAESERDALKRECEALLSRLTRATDLLDKAGPYVPFGKETKWLVQHISEFLEAPALSPTNPEPK